MENKSLEKMDSMVPATLAQAMDVAALLATSGFIPAAFQGKPNDVFAAILAGSDVGLKPMQALKNIAVINGRASVWGDALPGIVKSKPDYEWMTDEISTDGQVATCKAKRKGEPVVIRTFSMEDAKRAGLLEKTGPWKTYPKRMLQMRARALAIRDAWPHHVMGIYVAEEVMDIPEKDITDQGVTVPDQHGEVTRTDEVREKLKQSEGQARLAGMLDRIKSSETDAALNDLAGDLQDFPESDKRILRSAWKKRQTELAEK